MSEVSIDFAKKFRNEFYSKISNLELFPEMYQIVKKTDKIEIRKITIQKYVVLYFILKNSVYIVNIFSQRANYINLIKI